MNEKKLLNFYNTLVYNFKSVKFINKGDCLKIYKLFQKYVLLKRLNSNLKVPKTYREYFSLKKNSKMKVIPLYIRIPKLYQEYLSLRRNSKMKVIAYFMEDGLPLQKVIETLLYECCLINN